MKTTQKFPIIFMGLFVFILSAIAISIIFFMDQFNQWQDYRKTQNSILQGDERAIKSLEYSEIEIAKEVLADNKVKKAVVSFYIQENENPIAVISNVYDNALGEEILQDQAILELFLAYYFQQIDEAVLQNNFTQAFSLLNILKQKYPDSTRIVDKYQYVQNQKKQRLSKLTKQYTECWNQTFLPLLERTHCMIKARQEIEQVGIGHSLPSDSNLPTMYAGEVKTALSQRDYEQVEKLLLDWNNMLPEASEQRDKLEQIFFIHQQKQEIIADLSRYDREKIKVRLGELNLVPTLQAEILIIPTIKNNLTKFYLDEALLLIIGKDNKPHIDPITRVKLEQLYALVNNGTGTEKQKNVPNVSNVTSRPWYQTDQQRLVLNEKINKLLEQCQQHLNNNHLTTGSSGTAFACYREVLRQDPGNYTAVVGLQKIEQRYIGWTKKALTKNKLKSAKAYLTNLRKVNNLSPKLAELTMILNQKEVEQEKAKEKMNKLCEDCNCSNLLKQLSMGVKILTPIQKDFLKTYCQ
ncbi:MAG: hypothetical protein KAH84_11505 [Thiomargarita sp.]|nr:hypothetical protein [Thiomargarita sp.]